MKLDEIKLEELFMDQGDVVFLYNNKSYLIARYNIRRLFRKARIEYWFSPPADSSQDSQKFDTIAELLDVEIENHKLRDILNDIEIE